MTRAYPLLLLLGLVGCHEPTTILFDEEDLESDRRAREEAAQSLANDAASLLAVAERARDAMDAAAQATSDFDRRDEWTAKRDAVAQIVALAESARTLASTQAEGAAAAATVERAVYQARRAGGEDAVELYEMVVDGLVRTRNAMRETFEEDAPELAEILPAPSSTEIIRISRRVRAEWQTKLERLRWERLRGLAITIDQGNATRLSLLDQLPSSRRNALTGFGPDGRAQLGRELDQLALLGRYEVIHQRRALPNYPARAWELVQDPDTRGSVGWLFVWIVFGAWLLRRRPELMQGFENWVWRNAPSVRWRARLLPWAQRLIAISEPGLVLVFVALAFWLVDQFIQSPELAVVEVLILALLAYRVVIAGLYHELTGLRRSTTLRERVRRDLSLVGRTVLVLAILLGAAARLVGEGTLYAYLFRVSLLIAFVLAIVLLRRWTPEIRQMHRERNPDTRIARALANARGLRAFALTLAAGAVVLARSIFDATRRIILRFGAARKALAVLARRKDAIEETPQPLPDALRAFFPAGPCGFEQPPSRKALLDSLARDIEAEQAHAIAVIGECGAGKSSWMEAARDRFDAHLLHLPADGYEVDRLTRWLAKSLDLDVKDLEVKDGSVDALAAAVEETLADRVVLVDDAQNLFIRAVDGAAGFRFLCDLIGQTQDRVTWVCAFSAYAWRYLESVWSGQSVFGHTLHLQGLSDKEVTQTIDARMREAGFTASFEQLLEGAPAGAARHRALVRSREEYFRFLTDYTEGNMRLVSVYWLRSLELIDDHTVRVKLFSGPDPSPLDAMHDQTRFVLAAIVLHESLDVGELMRTLRLPRARAAALLDILTARGILECEDGIFTVTPHWFRVVVNHLLRRRLLP